MSQSTLSAQHAHGHEHEHQSHSVFGFWAYLMTDCVLFASLFATFAMFAMQTAGGPTPKDLFNLKDVAYETGLLLTSSLTFGLAMISATRRKSGAVLAWLFVTFLLGAGFLFLEMQEFAHLIAEGAGPQRSAFWSAFFTLVGTHGLHVSIGMIWLVVLAVQIARNPQMNERELRRLACLSLFWHFLDIVWICVFSFVYLGSVV
ncbi:MULTISPECIES: cytochrome o ubiquinol oxidase subunit III [Caballeronia]|jgi:cytochrome o ubiquinol oxidase subunit 3|uniref:Cytochrome bo(3) ubiquinol oxidase subunit 3 n=1 Tax=Caballeronia zhejiangensis TaxID=871203 RepID=A0A656QGH9_9BURK|nr:MULTISPECIES: cytochrome o ubiquinol oxidase subunit III [Caballeronia]EKS70488.1 ubiquinol oxidase subunit III [Burkholderia sp. SJ98]KDR28979.1 cytochrome o ubiquinol oxidase subunit III [Caballeronia zhejiangensis]MCG7401829.1 cytochrome o ubiquinol oxidase subunit III [Caballeronia zhejiangensis]MCI1046074.1 cytochrome o ubiquinol oxidase subunit III [Caballeronia zhejiangensis]MDR5767935.1 cytochrome o ubiquinol oxidase subunit III [Caballeronia sp. LZ028]